MPHTYSLRLTTPSILGPSPSLSSLLERVQLQDTPVTSLFLFIYISAGEYLMRWLEDRHAVGFILWSVGMLQDDFMFVMLTIIYAFFIIHDTTHKYASSVALHVMQCISRWIDRGCLMMWAAFHLWLPARGWPQYFRHWFTSRYLWRHLSFWWCLFALFKACNLNNFGIPLFERHTYRQRYAIALPASPSESLRWRACSSMISSNFWCDGMPERLRDFDVIRRLFPSPISMMIYISHVNFRWCLPRLTMLST